MEHVDRGVPLSTLCPKFLHTNSTSHTWPFSAIAELIDNAYDPDVNAKQFWIDKTVVQGQDCLSFMDNGNGLDHETMHKMLSFGYSDKTAVRGIKPIGMYGNGFKSGAMRLGKDAIVFSKSKSSCCVGMLSQTYLEEIGAKQIIVPIVCFEESETNKFSVREEQKASLQDILSYSPFKTQEELLGEIDAITSSWSRSKTGSRIIIWNLRRTSTGTTEFDFEKDRYDIRIPTDLYEELNDTSRQATSHIPESFYSLRAYCTILYLKPRMQIIIRGQKVKSQLIAKSLAYIRKDKYKPNFLPKPVHITFGYNTKSKDQYGIMMYHKNRLIKAYERVGCQLKANNKGVGVIGIVECGLFLEPTHNKQSFNETDKYRRTINSLGIKLEEYWQEIRHRRQTEDPNNNIPVEDTMKRPDQNWVQCDDCLRWRKLPDGIDFSKLPEKWYCRMNPDPQFRSCHVEEEAEDSDDDQAPYRKTYKQQERIVKRNEEKKRQKEEEERKRQEEQRLADLARQYQDLKRQRETLKRKLRETTVHSPAAPTTPRSRLNTESPCGAAVSTTTSLMRSSTISQAALSPSCNSGLPVISAVCSLSPEALRGKRTRPATPQATPKRPRVNGLSLGTSDTTPSVDESPQSSPSLLANNNDDDDDDDDITDDDIFILETASTPKPVKPAFDLTKVKTEQEQSDVNVGALCNNDAAMDVAAEAGASSTGSAAVGTSPYPAPPQQVSSTTQTQPPKVKEEEESQIQTEGEERAGQSTSNESVKDNESSDVKHHPANEEQAGPAVHHPSVTEVQQQQDQLLELMQATAQERDSYKEQVHVLTCQLHDTQRRLQELSEINVKKESSHQASQTEETEGGQDYKSLFEKAKQKVDELIKDKEDLLAATETKPSTAKGEERDSDEIALKVDRLIRELDQRNTERDGLRSQLENLEEERANLASQCEELRLSLQQQRENAQEGSTTPHSTTDSSSNTSTSLIELRHNIGRLLVSFVPALDLGQVNYECNVIDEILEQVLSDVESVTSLGQRNIAIS